MTFEVSRLNGSTGTSDWRWPQRPCDRGHIHHRLLDLGLTPRRAVMIVYCFCALAASVSLVQSTFHNHYSALFVLLFCVATGFAIANLRYAEFRAAGRLLVSATFHPDEYAMAKGTFRDQINMQVSLMNLQASLSQQERHESVDA